MEKIPRPRLTRIPGGDISLPNAKEKHSKDLTQCSRIELIEIKERESKLLNNKSKLARLPDKGKRIQDFYDKVIAELERRANVDEAAALFSELNIAAKGKDALNELEWSGRLDAMHEIDPTNDVLDSDDEQEMDPLRIIAKGNMHERNVVVLPPEAKLITAADLAEIDSFHSGSTDSGVETLKSTNTIENGDDESTDSASETSIVDAEIVSIDVGKKLSNIKMKLKTINGTATAQAEVASTNGTEDNQIEQHVRYLISKTEQPATSTATQREKFKPYKTTVSDVHAVAKERARKQGKHWEVTAATPPPIKHGATQMVSLLDSVQIQTNYLAKLKELQEKQAAERLAAKIERLQLRKIELPNSEDIKNNAAFTEYRTTPAAQIEGILRLNEEDEVHDPLDDERGGGVMYTVYE